MDKVRWTAITWIALWTLLVGIADETGLIVLPLLTIGLVVGSWSYYKEWFNELVQEVI